MVQSWDTEWRLRSKRTLDVMGLVVGELVEPPSGTDLGLTELNSTLEESDPELEIGEQELICV